MNRVEKMRHCFNCGDEMGVYADYDRLDTCGSRECNRAAQECAQEERMSIKKLFDLT